jgi:hypothetical protein
MLFSETMGVYCEDHTEHKYTLWSKLRVFNVNAEENGGAIPPFSRMFP